MIVGKGLVKLKDIPATTPLRRENDSRKILMDDQ